MGLTLGPTGDIPLLPIERLCRPCWLGGMVTVEEPIVSLATLLHAGLPPSQPTSTATSSSSSRSPVAMPQVSPVSTPWQSDGRHNASLAITSANRHALTSSLSADSSSSEIAVAAPAAIQQRLDHLGTTTAPPTPQTSLSAWLRPELKQQFGQDIDPDHTYLVSLNYNTDGESGKGPYPGQVVRKQSLTEAAMANSQAPDVGDAGNTVVPYRANGPDIQLTAHLPIKRPSGLGDLAYRYWAHGHDEGADYTYTYEGIYKESDPPRYDQRTQLALDPKDFRARVWTADPSKVVHAQLDGFWAEHEKDYAQKARISFFGAAFKEIPTSAAATYKPGDLKPDDRKLAAAMLKQPPEPGVECGRLTIHGYTSTDIMYARDRANGRMLLYIPGDKKRLHGFDSANELAGWLASEKQDVPARTALGTHFSAYDRQDGTSNLFSRSGVDSALAGMAAYPQDYAPPGLLWHKGQWRPDQEIGLSAIPGDPFDNLLKSTKERSYQDADTLVTSDKDVTEKNILKYLNIGGVVLGAVLVPLSAVGEGAGILTHVVAGLDAGAGVASIGIGLDERSRSKPGWADDAINGAMQVALAGTPTLAEKLAGAKGSPARKPADGKAWPNKPFFHLPQRFNGQIGYPLGPIRPPKKPALPSPVVKEAWQRAPSAHSSGGPRPEPEPPLGTKPADHKRDEIGQAKRGAESRGFVFPDPVFLRENTEYQSMLGNAYKTMAELIEGGEKTHHVAQVFDRLRDVLGKKRDAIHLRDAEKDGLYKLDIGNAQYLLHKDWQIPIKITHDALGMTLGLRWRGWKAVPSKYVNYFNLIQGRKSEFERQIKTYVKNPPRTYNDAVEFRSRRQKELDDIIKKHVDDKKLRREEYVRRRNAVLGTGGGVAALISIERFLAMYAGRPSSSADAKHEKSS
jgi:hypothetical protein